MVRSRKVVRGETRQDRVLERSHLGPLAGMLVSPRMGQQYASAVWYFVLCCVNLFGTVSEDLSVLVRQVSYFSQLIWADGETKSLAAHTICGLQHLLNVRAEFFLGPGDSTLYRTKQKFQHAHLRCPPAWCSVLLGGSWDKENSRPQP